MDNKIRLRLRIWPDEIGRRNGKPMHIHRYRRIHWIIPFVEKVLRNIPTIFQERIDKTLEFERPRLVSRHHNRSQKNIRKTRSG